MLKCSEKICTFGQLSVIVKTSHAKTDTQKTDKKAVSNAILHYCGAYYIIGIDSFALPLDKSAFHLVNAEP
ncbi:hypothetical protein AGMMS50239_23940 [Bacteroidia bacterium]|nr:hypothetical protein AGMMS50239_23940 [Bacteroidia bacterium]